MNTFGCGQGSRVKGQGKSITLHPGPFTLHQFCCWFFGLLVFWFFSASAHAEGEITLRIMAINPSKDQTQKAEVKAYLPKELQSEDILDVGDLEVAYDSQQGAYFVYGSYDLKPGETLEREIEIKDIWQIPVEELESLRTEAEKTAKLLEHTDFQERGEFLRAVIEAKVNKIIERQRVTAVNPEKHIFDHRDNLALLDSVKAELLIARSLLTQARPKTAVVMVWKLFIGIVLFLGLLGVSFYIIWHKQLKTITAPTFGTESAPAPGAAGAPSRQATTDKPIGPDDIERIIKGE